MEYKTKKLIMPKHLNGAGNLFGGTALAWIDKVAALCVMEYLDTRSIVTKIVSKIDFSAPAKQGDIIEIYARVIKVGIKSVTVEASIFNITTKELMVKVSEIVFVYLNKYNRPENHQKGLWNICITGELIVSQYQHMKGSYKFIIGPTQLFGNYKLLRRWIVPVGKSVVVLESMIDKSKVKEIVIKYKAIKGFPKLYAYENDNDIEIIPKKGELYWDQLQLDLGKLEYKLQEKYKYKD